MQPEQTGEAVGALFELKPTDDKMQVLLTCHPEFAGNAQATEEILAKMKRMKITADPDLDTLGKALKESLDSGQGITDLPIASGQQPVPPEDGQLKWMGDYFTEEYYIDPETKLIDFHRKIGDPSVEENQLLVKVTKGQPGQNGRDVFGRTITVPQPKHIVLRAGLNAHWDERESGYRARCAGRVKFQGQSIDVDPVYIIRSSVGVETGNIKHNGKLIIDGDVEMDFKVEATGEIEIRGLAYPSDIACGENLIVKGGINGDPSKKIEAKGDILAKYISNATVISEGNIISNNEIINCDIETVGEVNCNKGRVIGGQILGTNGITVGEAGSDGNIHTLLTAGVNMKMLAKLKACTEEIDRLKKAIKELDKAHRSLEVNVRILNHAQKEKMTEIQYARKEGAAEIERLKEAKKEISHKLRDYHKAEIKILDMAHPGVVIRICDCQYALHHALAGPIVARLDRLRGEIRLSSEMEGEEDTENEG